MPDSDHNERVTDAMVERALSKAMEEADLPYMARVRDHPDRADLKAADAEAESENRAWMRSVLEAALGDEQGALQDADKPLFSRPKMEWDK